MSHELSPTVAIQADELVEEIAGRHELAAELREELRGHVEDKMRGYIEGTERVSEQDALALTRNHFGDPCNLRELLSETHAELLGATMPQRIAAAMIASALGLLISGVLLNLLWAFTPVSYYEGTLVSVLFFTVICGGLLRHWSRNLAVRRTPRVLQWRPVTQGLVILVLLLVIQLLQPLYIWLWLRGVINPIVDGETDSLQFVLAFYSWVFACTLLWFWWCGARNEQQALVVLKSLWLFLLLTMISLFSFSDGSNSVGYSPAVTLFEQNNFYVTLMPHFPVTNIPTFVFHFVPVMALPLAAWALLVGFNRTQSKNFRRQIASLPR